MFKQMLMGLCALAFVGAGYTAVIAGTGNEGASDCCKPAQEDAQVTLLAETSTAPAAKTDVKNTKCLVMPEDDVTTTVEYNGKIYHVCCKSCVKKFNKDPEKYVKAYEADPSKFGGK